MFQNGEKKKEDKKAHMRVFSLHLLQAMVCGNEIRVKIGRRPRVRACVCVFACVCVCLCVCVCVCVCVHAHRERRRFESAKQAFHGRKGLPRVRLARLHGLVRW